MSVGSKPESSFYCGGIFFGKVKAFFEFLLSKGP